MKLQIKPNRTLNDIQKEFHAEFPMLKLEFFKKPHRADEPSAKKDLLTGSVKVSEVSKAPAGEFSVTGKSKVSEVEQALRKDFALYAQVFRKSGKVWLETTTTDEWTLDQQQQAAKESETEYIHSMHNFADERN